MADKVLARIVPVLPVRDLATDHGTSTAALASPPMPGKAEASTAFSPATASRSTSADSDALIEDKTLPRHHFYLADHTAAALEAEFLAAGVTLSERLAPREWKMNEFALRDPDGNQLVFGEGI